MDAFTLANAHGMEVRFIALGGAIVSVRVPDRRGVFVDITPGHDSVDAYEQDGRFFGAIIGRYANRIAGARFTLDGVEHELSPNERGNQLHGGPAGFHRAQWRVAPFHEPCDGAVLYHWSDAGDQGFPGTLHARVTYQVTDDNELIVDYSAITDAPTPVNLTQHTYFNLAGQDAGSILDHELTIRASSFIPVNAALLPSGPPRPVVGTSFDFTTPHRIGERIDASDEQLVFGHGYDHNFVLDRVDGPDTGFSSPVARVSDPASGRVMEIFTTEPGLQFYSGSGLGDGPPGKGGRAYARNAALALEPQHFPDSPNHPEYPSTILRPGNEYRSRTVYRFSTSSDQ
jgi:aldose 1-epimerase